MLISISAAAEDGSWYVRGGIGLDHPSKAEFSDYDCTADGLGYLYGCGTGYDGARRRSFGGFGNPGAVEAGVGFVVGPSMRVEALVAYRPRVLYRGKANWGTAATRQITTAKISSLSGMLTAYADLPLSSGTAGTGRVHPFVGVGLGVARNRVHGKQIDFTKTTTIVPGGVQTDTTWMVEVGSGIKLNARTTLDIAWRYTDLGVASTGLGDGSLVYKDGRNPLNLANLAPTGARITGLGMRLSLRYAF